MAVAVGFGKNPDGRMVVDAERFFGGQFARRRPAELRRFAPAEFAAGVVDVERANVEIGVELGDQFKAEFAVEQAFVVARVISG